MALTVQRGERGVASTVTKRIGLLAASVLALVAVELWRSDRAMTLWMQLLGQWDGGLTPTESASFLRDGLVAEVAAVAVVVLLLTQTPLGTRLIALLRTALRPDRVTYEPPPSRSSPCGSAIVKGHAVFLDGRRRWILSDDAMISMRYARNLVGGHGLVWNVGERVEGYTNFGWTVLLAIPHLLHLPDGVTGLFVLAMSLVIAAATLPFLARLVLALGGTHVAVVGTLAAFIVSRAIFVWSTSGLETGLLALLVVIAAVRVIDESRANDPRMTTALVMIAIAIVRADGLVLSVLLLGCGLVLHDDRRRWLRFCAAALVIPLAYHLARFGYYHELLPNTARLKVTHWSGRLQAGVDYTVAIGLRYQVLCVAALVAVLRRPSRVRVTMLSLVPVFAAYVVVAGGDSGADARFFVPVLPVVFALALIGATELADATKPQAVGAFLAVATIPAILPGYANTLVVNYLDTENVRLTDHVLAQLQGARRWLASSPARRSISPIFGVSIYSERLIR